MYSDNDLVTIYGIESDIPPAKLVQDITSSATEIPIDDFNNFITFEGRVVGGGVIGYVIIGSEIIGYSGVNSTSSPYTLNSLTHGIDSTLPTSHFNNELVFKYEFNGISLRKLNKQHSLADTNTSIYPTELDNYHIKISNNDNIFFKQSKTGGSYLYDNFSLGSFRAPRATQNISYNILRPITSILTPANTEISSRIRTITSKSVYGNEIPFVDMGYEDFALNSDNTFNSMRGICSRINEIEYVTATPNNKSLSLQIELNSTDSKVSPMIDLERIGMISVMNRIDSPINDYITDSRVNTLLDDPTSAIYISQLVRLEKPADSLKVLFDAYRHSSNDIRVAYRIFRDDTPNEYQLYQLFPGYGNIDSRGNTIDLGLSNGLPDRLITPSGNASEYKSYEYNMKSNIIFTGFQIKIIMTGTDQANVPKIRDLRAISTL